MIKSAPVLLTLSVCWAAAACSSETQYSITHQPEPAEPVYDCPDENHPHLIDLGLPSGLKWACCNVGAVKPDSAGGYYAWGETEEKDDYVADNYKHYENGHYKSIGGDISGGEYDVAHTKWGGRWRMPTIKECQELVDSCSWTWCNVYRNGLSGYRLTARNGHSIFLPAAGFKGDGLFSKAGFIGFYWSSTYYSGYPLDAWILYFTNQNIHNAESDDRRDYGRSVRAVWDERENQPE